MISVEPESGQLTLLLDFRQPFAYLALRPAVDLARECGAHIELLPIVVPPLKSPSQPGPADDRGVRHRRYRAQAIAREIEVYAQAQGLVLKELHRTPDPTALNLAWLWVRQEREARLLPFLEEAFRRYWAVDLDPCNEEEVAALLDSSDAGGPGFREWSREEGADVAEALAGTLRERGLSRSPCTLVADEVFVGRQHLPMIRWILGGREGPGPI